MCVHCLLPLPFLAHKLTHLVYSGSVQPMADEGESATAVFKSFKYKIDNFFAVDLEDL